jgi:hypothetical protein
MAHSNKKTKEKIEETGGELTSIPNEKYGKFFAKFAEIDTLDVTQWKVAHILGYFCKKYHETYGLDYPWKFNHQNPNKCFEVWQFNTLCAKLSANPKILKEYIDWAYQNLVPKAKRRFTSISFLTRDEVVNPYKMNILLGGKRNLNIDRSSELPEQYREIFRDIGIFIGNYGELAFLAHMSLTPRMVEAFQKLEDLGFDKEILERIV